MKIFLSYSTKDEQIVRSVEKLMPSEVFTWIDHKKISGGSILNNKIKKGINESDMFFVFISQDSIDSEWVLKEINWAMEKEKKLKYDFIVPVVLNLEAWEKWKKNPIDNRNYIFYDSKETLYLLANDMKNSIVDKTIEKFNSHCIFKAKIVENVVAVLVTIICSIAFFTEPTEKEHIQNLQAKFPSCNSSQIKFEDIWLVSYATCSIGQKKELFSFGAFNMIFVRENQNR